MAGKTSPKWLWQLTLRSLDSQWMSVLIFFVAGWFWAERDWHMLLIVQVNRATKERRREGGWKKSSSKEGERVPKVNSGTPLTVWTTSHFVCLFRFISQHTVAGIVFHFPISVVTVFVFSVVTLSTIGVRCIVISVSVCLSTCVSKETTCANFSKSSLHVTCGCGSVLTDRVWYVIYCQLCGWRFHVYVFIF